MTLRMGHGSGARAALCLASLCLSCMAFNSCAESADRSASAETSHPVARPVARGAVTWREWPPDWRDGKVVMVFLNSNRSFWSRDMATRCFGDPNLAAETMRLTQPIWVDADERPDLAARYSLGAWPSLAFLTPEGDWVTGTTYIDPDDYDRLLRRASLYFEIPERREDLERNRENLLARLKPTLPRDPEPPTRSLLDRILDRAALAADSSRHVSPEVFLALARERGFGKGGQKVPFPLLALSTLGPQDPGGAGLADSELHLGVVSSRIRAMALAGQAADRADWIDAARAAADEVLDRLSTNDGLLAAGEGAFLAPDSSNVYVLRYSGRGPVDARTLTAWNARAASALSALGNASGRHEYSTRAHDITQILLDGRLDDLGRVRRMSTPAEVYFLEDAAFLAQACLDVDGFLDDARRIVDRALQQFGGDEGQLRDRWPDEGQPLSSTVDRELASPVGVFAEVLVDLALRTDGGPYAAIAQEVIGRYGPQGLDAAHRSGGISGAIQKWLIAEDRFTDAE